MTQAALSGLTDKEVAELLQGVADGSIDYVVFSYKTPIAWYNKKTNTWYVIKTKFSVTTSRHQNIVKGGINAT